MLNFFNKTTKNLQVSNKIYKVNPSDDLYHTLQGVHGNRDINYVNVDRLKKSVERNDVLRLRPIVVREENESLVIVDGQHRYEVAKMLSRPFYIMIDDSYNDMNLINMNTHQRNWTLADFASYWSQRPETADVYNIYKKYKEEYTVSHSILIAIFNKTSSYKSGSWNFKEGNLKYDSFNEEHVKDRLSKIKRMQRCATNPTFEHNVVGKQQFHGALLEALENSTFDFEKFLDNLKRSRHKFNYLANVSDYKKEIFRIEKKRTKNVT